MHFLILMEPDPERMLQGYIEEGLLELDAFLAKHAAFHEFCERRDSTKSEA